ncbi:hypothetical protein ACQ4PT_018658 [Festuca glaucescens]
MANFPVDPHRFVPAGFHVLEPWGADECPARMYVTAAAAPPWRDESWAIAQVLLGPDDGNIDQVLNQVHDHIEDHLHWNAVSFAESVVGLGLLRMADSSIRDLLVAPPPHHLGHGRMLTFVRHDEGGNFRSTVYTRLSWIMMLNLPMDYRTEEFLHDSISKFGKITAWQTAPLGMTQNLLVLWCDVLMVVPGMFQGPLLLGSLKDMEGLWCPSLCQYAFLAVNLQKSYLVMSPLSLTMEILTLGFLWALSHRMPTGSHQCMRTRPIGTMSGGHVYEVVVEPAPWDVVEIEDVTDEIEEDVAVVDIVADDVALPVNNLAIVPYVDNVLHQMLFHQHKQRVVDISAVKEQSVARRLYLEDTTDSNQVDLDADTNANESASMLQEMEIEDNDAEQQITKKRGRGKQEVTESEAGVRRSTRQSVLKNGYKLEPMRDKTIPKKKPRCKPMKENKEDKPMKEN